MELVDIVPEFNLYEEFWKIYTKADAMPPQYIDAKSTVTRCIIGEGTEIYGDVTNSVIGSGVTIGEGAVVKDSIIMNGVSIEAGAYIEKAVIAENVQIGANTKLGIGEEAVNDYKLLSMHSDLLPSVKTLLYLTELLSVKILPLLVRQPQRIIKTVSCQAAAAL